MWRSDSTYTPNKVVGIADLVSARLPHIKRFYDDSIALTVRNEDNAEAAFL
jgi:hypothetical protein